MQKFAEGYRAIQKRLKLAKLLKNIKSKLEDAIKLAFKTYSSSNQLKRLYIKEKAAISDDF